jgi:hypothetical protein
VTSSLELSFHAETGPTPGLFHYPVGLTNNGRGEAMDALIQPIDEGGQAWGEPTLVGAVKGQGWATNSQPF